MKVGAVVATVLAAISLQAGIWIPIAGLVLIVGWTLFWPSDVPITRLERLIASINGNGRMRRAKARRRRTGKDRHAAA